jgi:nitrogen fixation-related uncharacterized protein
MSVVRRSMIVVAALAVLGVGLVLLWPRFKGQFDDATPTATDGRRESANDAIPRTSEEVIADALKKGDIGYEESLLQRAYAIFDDPRLDPLFRSPVMNWDAASELFVEVDAKEAMLSAGLLAALEPFRVRPNDPRSIVNRPRAEIVRTQQPHGSAIGWIGRAVPNTNLRIWIKGSPVDLDPYEPLFEAVWREFQGIFSYPDDDDPGPDLATNPDGAIDFYLIHGREIDPRVDYCLDANSNPLWCTIGATGGVTKPANPRGFRKSSAYVLLNRSMLNEDILVDAIAHELAHVTQFGYDNQENSWLKDSTASWVAYRVMKKLRRNPRVSYDYAARFMKGLHLSLDRIDRQEHNQYDSWLFFFYASTELGDHIVEEVWRQAERGGFDNIKAVNAVIPLDTHFPQFTVRNWNRAEPGPAYPTWDRTFRPGLMPDPINLMPTSPAMMTLDDPLPKLSAQYYHYTAFDENVRRITLQNFYAPVPDAHIWALKKVGSDWKMPEDWSRSPTKVLCRDLPDDDVSELVLIVSNSSMTDPLPGPQPRVVTEEVGCETIEGTASATLRLRDPNGSVDVNYVASLTTVQFKPRTVQDQEFNVQYDLLPTSVVWSVTGREGDCTINGRAVVNIPSFIDQELDPVRPAWGYLNVVSKEGGDFHSIHIAASDPAARATKTCPGDPPRITRVGFQSYYLSKILTQTNTHRGSDVIYSGRQTLDFNRVQDNLPTAALEVLKNLPQAQQILNQQGGRMVYTFEWEMRPRRRSP